MSEEKKKQNRPLNQEEVEEMLDRGEFFDGLEIGDVDFSDDTFKNCLNFEGATFIGIANFQYAKFLNGADFSRAVFSGKDGAFFNGTEFSGEESADFMGAIFSGELGADFSDTVFIGKGGADFMSTTFSGKGAAIFDNARFSGDRGANFIGAEFIGEGGADFHSAKFIGNGGANFIEAKFSVGGADFRFAKFFCNGGAKFNGASFSGEKVANFSNAIFSGVGGTDFNSAVFSSNAGVKFTDAKFMCEDRISFEDVEFGKDCIIYFDNVIVKNPKNLFFRNTYLGNTTFFQTDVEDFNFKNVSFRELPPDEINWLMEKISIHREVILDEIWNDTAPEEDQREYNEQYYSQVEIIYRQLKRNFEENRDYSKAGDFHFGEMEMKRLQKSKFKQYISLTALYKYFSGYGQKWERSFYWFVAFVALFTLINLNRLEPIYELNIETIINGNISLEAVYVPPTYIDSFIYTFKTMTLRTDKRFQITDPIGSLFVIFQSVIGPTLLALMFLAIRRQFRR